jgi:hypothetical protein
MKIWWCNQSRTWNEERRAGVVCSTADSDRVHWHHESVGEVRQGDLIVHYRKPHVVAFSRELENGAYHNPLPDLGEVSYGFGWRFKTEYFDLPQSIVRTAFGKTLVSHIVKYFPIKKDGSVNLGYLFKFSEDGLSVVLSHTSAELPAWLAPYCRTSGQDHKS